MKGCGVMTTERTSSGPEAWMTLPANPPEYHFWMWYSPEVMLAIVRMSIGAWVVDGTSTPHLVEVYIPIAHLSRALAYKHHSALEFAYCAASE